MMANITETKISSGELGVIWMSYHLKTMLGQITGKFAQQTTEPEAKAILNNFTAENNKNIDSLRAIFGNNNAIVPIAFNNKDVINDAPSLFDDIFHIMYLRIMAQILLGINAIHMGMSYRKDIREFFDAVLKFSGQVYSTCTEYLTRQGVLPRPPYATLPNEIQFIENKEYMDGTFKRRKRTLNDLEVSYIYAIIEANVMGMQLMTGFAQVAKEKDVRDYFVKGKDLAKNIMSDMSELFLESDVQMPTTWAGKATDSVVAPFSDKMMMYMCDILSSYSVGGNELGLAFNLRGDLRLKLAALTAKTLNFSIEGGKIMIKRRWLERPPQLEDRRGIIAAEH